MFVKQAYGSTSPEIRHFHTVTVDPYTGYWYLSSGDRPPECMVWISKDDGTTWTDVTDYDFDPTTEPKVRTQALFRLTTMWFTPQYICWATDDRINGTGAKLVISPRTEPLDIHVLGTVSYNHVRSSIEFPGIGWLLITEDKTGLSYIETTFVTNDFHIIPLCKLQDITGYFSSSIASKRAYWDNQKNCYIGYSLARGLVPRIVRYELYRDYQLNIGIEEETGGRVNIEPTSNNHYRKGEKVKITAVEEPGYIFTGWSGDYVSSSRTIQLVIEKDTYLTAHFYPRDIEPEFEVSLTSRVSLVILIIFISITAILSFIRGNRISLP